MITKKQKEVLDFIKFYQIKKGYSPSLEEIANKIKVASVSTAHHHVKKLEKEGLIHKEVNQPRAVTTKSQISSIQIPILGSIAAGQPIEALEVPAGSITVPRSDIGQGKHYALRVEGSSMIDEGIFDGDMVVIREQKGAENGQTVVAIIDDNQATLKKIYREKRGFRLQPANPSLFPIFRDSVEVRGVVVKIVRNLATEVEKESTKEKYVRRIDYSWDYQGEKTKSYTHGLHPYPAMFIPQVARRLLETYSKPGDTICDIFCGSGTALVESKVLGRNAYGIDLNPLAIFLAQTKTTPISPKILEKSYADLIKRLSNTTKKEVKKPSFKNLEFWFKDKKITELALLKNTINQISEKKVRNFFMVAFSETVRYSSNTKTGEFKLVRINKEKLEKHDPDVLNIFLKKTVANISKMKEFYKDVQKKVKTTIIYGDSSKDNDIGTGSIDCIVTSPPYGDSGTTVAYGQFSRLSAQWIDIFEEPNDASSVDGQLLGGKASKTLSHSLESKHLNDSIKKIAQRDPVRAREVLSFYLGLSECLKQAHRMLRHKKYFCLVIGNRMVKQVRIPTDFIIAELGEKIGFTCEDIIVRNIPGKRMPSKNSPTNIVGALEETMNQESIVILRKN